MRTSSTDKAITKTPLDTLRLESFTLGQVTDLQIVAAVCENYNFTHRQEYEAKVGLYANVYMLDYNNKGFAIKTVGAGDYYSAIPDFCSDCLEVDFVNLDRARMGEFTCVPKLVAKIVDRNNKLLAIVTEEISLEGRILKKLLEEGKLDVEKARSDVRKLLEYFLCYNLALVDPNSNNIIQNDDNSWMLIDAGALADKDGSTHNTDRILDGLFAISIQTEEVTDLQTPSSLNTP